VEPKKRAGRHASTPRLSTRPSRVASTFRPPPSLHRSSNLNMRAQCHASQAHWWSDPTNRVPDCGHAGAAQDPPRGHRSSVSRSCDGRNRPPRGRKRPFPSCNLRGRPRYILISSSGCRTSVHSSSARGAKAFDGSTPCPAWSCSRWRRPSHRALRVIGDEHGDRTSRSTRGDLQLASERGGHGRTVRELCGVEPSR